MLSGLTCGFFAAMYSSGYVQRTVEPAPSSCRSIAGRPWASIATTEAPGRVDGQVRARALRAGHRERQPRSRLEVAERLDEVEGHDLVLDRIDEAVAQPVPTPKSSSSPVSHGPRWLGVLPAKNER